MEETYVQMWTAWIRFLTPDAKKNGVINLMSMFVYVHGIAALKQMDRLPWYLAMFG